MYDYEGRAMFEPELANDDTPEAHSLLDAIATVDGHLDATLALLSAVGLLGALLFAFFVASMI